MTAGAPPEPERVTQALGQITSQAGKLTRLLNHLLDVSRLEAGKLLLDQQRADLHTLLEQVVSNAQVRTPTGTLFD